MKVRDLLDEILRAELTLDDDIVVVMKDGCCSDEITLECVEEPQGNVIDNKEYRRGWIQITVDSIAGYKTCKQSSTTKGLHRRHKC